ncbi:MAG: MGH1-like glycoside hydrolase domain-containing protein [Alphaproteobacteria bacterium]
MTTATAEAARLSDADTGKTAWRRWGPYLSERQWGTVREDYSAHGTAWDHLPHDNARSQAYRWGEDGIAGLSDDRQYLCLALALWNGNDPILKERLFGLTNDQGNHGEDVKEYYFYQDSTPTHSYMRMLYKYPQAAFPYADLVAENARRKATDPAAFEYELMDTGVFDGDRYFDVTVEYAKRTAEDILMRVTVTNRGPDAASIWILPTLWFRNIWSWQRNAEKPALATAGERVVEARHPELGLRRFVCPDADALLFCENETNAARLYGLGGPRYPKDGINDHVVHGAGSVDPAMAGTKAAALYRRDVPAGGTISVTLRLADAADAADLGGEPEALFQERRAEADAFYDAKLPAAMGPDRRAVARQAHAGMLWSKQFFHYVVADWLDGDEMPPPAERLSGRNAGWRHFYAEDVISMPDKWEYPWFASWDLGFHTVVLARTDLQFAKDQVMLLKREWYMRPDGQVPAYEWAFDDVNPPVQVWAGLRIAQYERETTGRLDTAFLRRLFDHGLLYFTWWVNRKDADGNNLFQGGFLGLDNISVFDRSSGYLPSGGRLYQSDGTAWVGFFALTMMETALLLAEEDSGYHELAAKFFQHYMLIADALDHVGRVSDGAATLWDAEDGLYYDVLRTGDGAFHPVKVRSLVSVLPMIAVAPLDLAALEQADNPAMARRLAWFERRQDTLFGRATEQEGRHEDALLLSFLARDQLVRLLGPLLDEAEFLSPHGIRSLSRRHADTPFVLEIDGQRFEAGYQPAESHSGMFGGNSNWRGPVWMPINYLIIDALRAYHRHYGETLTVECPTGSGNLMTLAQVADELSRRLVSIFERGPDGRRPVYGGNATMQADPAWAESLLFYEYFHGDNGAGIGASHQTGWTGLVAVLIETLGRGEAAVPSTRARTPEPADAPA